MTIVVEPHFLPGSRGRLFGLYMQGDTPPRDAFVYLPPFAEEMNRCRVLAAEQARRLAALGIATLLLDPYGTGDSDGDLEAASWSDWQADALAAAEWLGRRAGRPVSLWGLRLGALLASSVFESAPQRFERLLLWQPVANGKQFLTQYLRLRVAWLMERDLPAETTDGIREALAGGRIVEVAGYPISGSLSAGIDAARLPGGDTDLAGKRVDWLENVAEAGAEPSVGARRAIAQLEQRNAAVRTITFCGAPLWQLHKRDSLPELIDVTTSLLGDAA